MRLQADTAPDAAPQNMENQTQVCPDIGSTPTDPEQMEVKGLNPAPCVFRQQYEPLADHQVTEHV